MTEEEQEKAIEILLEGIAVGYKYGYRCARDNAEENSEPYDPVSYKVHVLEQAQEQLRQAFRYEYEKPSEEAIKIARTIKYIWNKQDIHKREEFDEITI